MPFSTRDILVHAKPHGPVINSYPKALHLRGFVVYKTLIMSNKTKHFFVPQVAHFHGQQFAVMIEDNLLTLVVRNADGSWKKLPYAAQIREARPPKPAWLVQTNYEALFLDNPDGWPLTVWNKAKNAAYSKEEEMNLLQNKVGTVLLDRKLHELFPQNRHVQYAE